MPEQLIDNLKNSLPYNPFFYQRRKTREVMVGSVGVGGNNPLRVQSMVTTDTMNSEATVAQTLRLVDVGCEIVRITAPTVLDAQNLEKIKSTLLAKSCTVPLVADIHFRPDAAMVAADYVEKVRINPGNFVDGKAFKTREYTDEEYLDELRRIEDKFTPLVLKMKKLKRAMRIGTNHGSLSDRIMNRYGDTPEGMVESALEYVRICEKNQYFDIIMSMKASNPRVMIAAYRLLAQRMAEENMEYPFHLGVTEAGDGPDGRIKSAAGIGSLLEDGIGDTIRVSLTEDPEFEIPVAKEIARRYSSSPKFSVGDPIMRSPTKSFGDDGPRYVNSIFLPERRVTEPVMTGPIMVGGASPIRIVSRLVTNNLNSATVLAIIEERVKRDTPPEILEIPFFPKAFQSDYPAFRTQLLQETKRLALWVSFQAGQVPETLSLEAEGFVYQCEKSPNEDEIHHLMDACRKQSATFIIKSSSVETLSTLVSRLQTGRVPLIAALVGEAAASVHGVRALVAHLREKNSSVPLLLTAAGEKPSLNAAVVIGSLICDGIGDAVSVADEILSNENLDFSYNLLQACGSRITKTEFVSCPSCGRTLFDLQSTTERIKSKTGHLKGVKIAIMGCIVNGPGEMADADFGYVGGGVGKINLYVGKTCVQKSIPSDVADETLIQLIKSHGKWVDPQ